MKAFIMLMLFCFIFSQARTQGTDVSKVKYISSVYLLGSEIPLKGAIVTTGDSTIALIPKSLLKNKNLISPDLIRVIPSASINKIEIGRKKGAGRGALFGIAGGAVFAGLFDLVTGGKDDFFPSIIFTVPGLVAGTIVGANRKTTIKINGNPASYALNREKVKKYTLTGN